MRAAARAARVALTDAPVAGGVLQESVVAAAGESMPLASRLAEVRDAIDEKVTAGASRDEAEVDVISELCMPFQPDAVQLDAFRSHAGGCDVVCCMPTGSGKTAIGLFAAWRALVRGRRIFYTTPLKALSAQKRREFAQAFGDDAVGLVTGDHCVVPDAFLVVMTTEVLRNLFYPEARGVGFRALPRTELNILDVIVLDELHWISNQERGTAWEETIMYCPKGVRIVGLSATVGGTPQIFCDWVASVREDTPTCALITSSVRPVPLDFSFMGSGRCGQRLFWLSDAAAVEDGGSKSATTLMQRRESSPELTRLLTLSKMLRRLRRLQWLPAITFVMSRRGCDLHVEQFAASLKLRRWRRCRLVTQLERESISVRLENFARLHPEVDLSPLAREALLQGVAAHHAGQLPAQRALVEHLFELGLIKMVFATETLAAGVNMPARAVVLSSPTKYDGRSPRALSGTELLQMSGRAGRRGLDTAGHAVLCPAQDGVAGIASWATATLEAGPEPLKSNFRPSYAMICALLQERSEEEVKMLVSHSFGAYLRRTRHGSDSSSEQREVDLQDGRPTSREADAAELREIRGLVDSSGFTESSLDEYVDLYDRREREAEFQQRLTGQLSGGLDGDPDTDLLGGGSGRRLDGRLFGHLEDDPLDGLFGGALEPEEEDSRALEAVTSDVARHEVHNSPLRADLLSAIRRRRVLRKRCRRSVGSVGLPYHAWSSFRRYVAVLEDVAYLQRTKASEAAVPELMVTSRGAMASQLATGANTLWLGSLLLPEPLGGGAVVAFDLSPASVAALVAAVASDVPLARGGARDAPRDAGDVDAELVPDALREVVAWARGVRWRLMEIQWSHGVDEPMPLDLDAMALAYSWASGADWQDLSAAARARGHDDGGLFRCLRRTVEVLRGAVYVLTSPDDDLNLRVTAALEAMDRGPLAENLALYDGASALDL